MASTFTGNVWNVNLKNPAFRYYIDGTSSSRDKSRGHWGFGFLCLARYEYRIQEALTAWFDFKNAEPYIAVTSAMLAVAMQEHYRWAPGAPIACEPKQPATTCSSTGKTLKPTPMAHH